MKVSVYDQELFKWDDLIGSGEILIETQGVQTVPIYLKEKHAGEVIFSISKKY